MYFLFCFSGYVLSTTISHQIGIELLQLLFTYRGYEISFCLPNLCQLIYCWIFQQFQPLTTGDRFGLVWSSDIPNCTPHLVQIVIKGLTTSLRSPWHMSCSHSKVASNIRICIPSLFLYDLISSSCSVNYYSKPFHLPVFLFLLLVPTMPLPLTCPVSYSHVYIIIKAAQLWHNSSHDILLIFILQVLKCPPG